MLHCKKVFVYINFQNVLVAIKKWSTYFKVTTTVLTPLCRYFYYLQHAYNCNCENLTIKVLEQNNWCKQYFVNI